MLACMCTMDMSGAYKEQKRESDPPEPVSQIIVSRHGTVRS